MVGLASFGGLRIETDLEIGCMAEKKLTGAGLRGQVAGETALCTVGKTGTGLTYRGHDISVLAEKAKFEEVAFLLLKGHLPTQGELDAYVKQIKGLRALPQALKDVLERIPASAHPMDVMRTGCSMLGNLETETSFAQQDAAIDRLLAALPSIICYWYRFSHDGKRIETALDDDSIGAHFLHMLSHKTPSDLFTKVMMRPSTNACSFFAASNSAFSSKSPPSSSA